jgi:hypothetical protein
VDYEVYMMAETNKTKGTFLTNEGKKFKWVFLFGFFVSGGLLWFDYGYLKQKCDPSLKPETVGLCVSSGVVNSFANDVIVTLLGLMGINLLLRERSSAEIKSLFQESIKNALQETRNFKYFSYSDPDSNFDNLYQEKVRTFIYELQPKSIVKIPCLSETIPCLNQINPEIYNKKVETGCEFKILTLDPECPILEGMDIHNDNSKETHKNEVDKFKSRAERLPIKDKIEVRHMKNVYSSYSLFLCEGSDSNLIWIRSISSNGYHFLDFGLLEKTLIKQIDLEFDILWNKFNPSPPQVAQENLVS